MGKEINAIITKAEPNQQTKNGKPITKITIRELSTGQSYDVTVWMNVNVWNFNAGDDVMLTLNPREYKGKTYYSCSYDSISPVVKEEEKSAGQGGDMSADDWYEKEMRGHRRACLAIASNLLTEEEKKIGVIDIERVNLVMLAADKLVDYVLGNDMQFPPEEDIDRGMER